MMVLMSSRVRRDGLSESQLSASDSLRGSIARGRCYTTPASRKLMGSFQDLRLKNIFCKGE